MPHVCTWGDSEIATRRRCCSYPTGLPGFARDLLTKHNSRIMNGSLEKT